jgi:hypothetical protein
MSQRSAAPKTSLPAALDIHMPEPRGATDFVRVKDLAVRWERTIETGVRLGIDKPKSHSGGHSSPAGASQTDLLRPHHRHGLRASVSSKSLRERMQAQEEHGGEEGGVAGMLAKSELRISVKSVSAALGIAIVQLLTLLHRTSRRMHQAATTTTVWAM